MTRRVQAYPYVLTMNWVGDSSFAEWIPTGYWSAGNTLLESRINQGDIPDRGGQVKLEESEYLYTIGSTKFWSQITDNRGKAQNPQLAVQVDIQTKDFGLDGNVFFYIDFMAQVGSEKDSQKPFFVDNPKFGKWSMTVDLSALAEKVSDLSVQTFASSSQVRYYRLLGRALLKQVLPPSARIYCYINMDLSFKWQNYKAWFPVFTSFNFMDVDLEEALQPAGPRYFDDQSSSLDDSFVMLEEPAQE